LLNVITGFYKHEEGNIYFHGELIDDLPIYTRILKGIAMTFQIPRELRNLTVLDNLMLCIKNQEGEKMSNVLFRRKLIKTEENKNRLKAMKVLEFLHLEHLANEYAMNLSTGQKKLLELGRALMLDAQLFLLDEPFAGVHPKLIDEISEVILKLRNMEKTFLIVEHNVELIAKISEVISFMSDGKVLCTGKPLEILEDERVIKAYLGGVEDY